ncbi:MAG TPA: hypothetical protein VJL90_12710 [Pseudorhodoplanes sp.]|nr:hypothetical protein [Pseudorhodoplanes sp.]
MAKPYKDMTEAELAAELQRYGVNDLRYEEPLGELERREKFLQIRASKAQIASAWLQLAAVVSMFITTAISAYVQWKVTVPK